MGNKSKIALVLIATSILAIILLINGSLRKEKANLNLTWNPRAKDFLENFSKINFSNEGKQIDEIRKKLGDSDHIKLVYDIQVCRIYAVGLNDYLWQDDFNSSFALKWISKSDCLKRDSNPCKDVKICNLCIVVKNSRTHEYRWHYLPVTADLDSACGGMTSK